MGLERRGGVLHATAGRPTTEVIYEGNRTAHAPLNALPSRQWWKRGVRTNALEDAGPQKISRGADCEAKVKTGLCGMAMGIGNANANNPVGII